MGQRSVGRLLELGSQGDGGAPDLAHRCRLPPCPCAARLARHAHRMAPGGHLWRGHLHFLWELLPWRPPHLFWTLTERRRTANGGWRPLLLSAGGPLPSASAWPASV